MIPPNAVKAAAPNRPPFNQEDTAVEGHPFLESLRPRQLETAEAGLVRS
jgi:hypothetical protein